MYKGYFFDGYNQPIALSNIDKLLYYGYYAKYFVYIIFLLLLTSLIITIFGQWSNLIQVTNML